MKTKNIFKALALAMLMPATMLNTACSSDDDLAANNNEITNKKGFEIPVTINVTRQGDATTRATYTDNGNGTGSLAFSAGDKLFVFSYDGGSAGEYAGVLDWVSDGTFSGTIYTQYDYTGTIDALLSGGDPAVAVLLPAGYGDYGYLSTEGNSGSYKDGFTDDYKKAFVASTTEKTAKALAVEQFSFENAAYKSGGFALKPNNAILSFTITGLTASTNVTATIKAGEDVLVSGSVTTDGSGNATFAMGIESATEINPLTLTVGGKEITITSTNTVFDAGKIYNVTRSAAPAPAATSLSELKTAINGGTDCSSYIGWEVNSAGAIAESGVSGTKIGYVAYVSTSDVDAGVSGSRILVIASADAAANTTWGSYGTYRHLETVKGANNLNGYSNTNTLQGYGSEAHPAAYAAWNYGATIPSGGASPAHWFMPTQKQWENMRDAKGGTYGAMSTAYGISGHYWTSSEYFNGENYSECANYAWRFVTNSNFQGNMKSLNYNVRSIFAY